MHFYILKPISRNMGHHQTGKKIYPNSNSELIKVINLYTKRINNNPKDSSILYPSLVHLKRSFYKHTKLILGYKNTHILFETR